MSGFEPKIVFEPSSKFYNAIFQKKFNDWFSKNQKTEASKLVDEIKAKLNRQSQSGFEFSTLNQYSQYTDYDFFEWVVWYCKVKDGLINIQREI